MAEDSAPMAVMPLAEEETATPCLEQETSPQKDVGSDEPELLSCDEPKESPGECAPLEELVVDAEASTSPDTRLPWGAVKEKMAFPANIKVDSGIRPGEFVLRTLFAEFTVQAGRKIEMVLAEPLERTLSKSLQRGEDFLFDQLLSALGNVSEHCLPSLLQTLFAWLEKQSPGEDSGQQADQKTNKAKNKGEKDYLCERRELAVEFIYCLVLIEVLKQLQFHPGHDDLVNHILSQAFRHFKCKETVAGSPNEDNINIIADLFSEVLGVLAQSRFQCVKKKFHTELKELRAKEPSPSNTQSIVSLIVGMKFFRVKLHRIQDFEAGMAFLSELGNYYLETKDKEIRQALAGVFVEILLPMSAVVTTEVNVPLVRDFVEKLYFTNFDLAAKSKKHQLVQFPMVTCLLCVSQRSFFLKHWQDFLTLCLSQLKNRDSKMSRVALESLYRLVWVYVIRIKCESNTNTQSRLRSIVNSLFPKGMVVPKGMPLNIFVKIIQYVAKERLDFAMKEIVCDLLSVGRQFKVLLPERMNIGLRAFLVVADSLQQKEGDPPMPQTTGVLPSGCTVRVKKTFLNKMLTETTAKSIGIAHYYPGVRKAFDAILRALDTQVGKPLLSTKTDNASKDMEDILLGDRKPKIDLFRTCVAAIPRLIPEGMTRLELIDLLSRLTVHLDEELKGLAIQSLHNLVVNFPEWRQDVLHGFVQFIQKEVADTQPQMLDNALRLLGQYVIQWKTAASSAAGAKEKSEPVVELSAHRLPYERSAHAAVLNEVEALSLVMLCSCRSVTRKLAVNLLKEARNLFHILGFSKVDDPCVLDVIDRALPSIIENVLPTLPAQERNLILATSTIDLQWLADRTSSTWLPSMYSHENQDSTGIVSTTVVRSFDPWLECLTKLMDGDYVVGYCPHAATATWPLVFSRLEKLLHHVDPDSPQNDNRSSSLLRSGMKKMTQERDCYMNLWYYYVVFACRLAPSTSPTVIRCSSPDLSSSPESTSSEKSDAKANNPNPITAANLFKMLVPRIRCETEDMRDAVVNGLGKINPDAFQSLIDELLPYIKDAIDRKQENNKRKKKRDVLRLQLGKIFHLLAEGGTFSHRVARVLDKEKQSLASTFVDYIDGARLYLENEGERDTITLQLIRTHFSGFITQLTRHPPVDSPEKLLTPELRYTLFYLFASWSGRFGDVFGATCAINNKDEGYTQLERSAVQAMSAVLCCGPAFDQSSLNEGGYVYSWLDVLLSSHDDTVYLLAQETMVHLLENNSDSQYLLEWIIDRCYTGSSEVADGCFNALTTVFNNRDYPCHQVPMLNVALLYIGCPRQNMHETALQLFYILDKRFFVDEQPIFETASKDGSEEDSPPTKSLEDFILSQTSTSYCQSQLLLSGQLAHVHPDLTMTFFSEITQRFQTAQPSLRSCLLRYLHAWMLNLELVDPNLSQGDEAMSLLMRTLDGSNTFMQPPLQGPGWGSQQATEMVLNNLLYITVKFGDFHPDEVECLWSALVTCYPHNLKVIVRYLVIVTGMATAELLPYSKRVIVYLGRAQPQCVIEEMTFELQLVETLHFMVERTQACPFYRLTNPRKMTNCSVTSGEDHPKEMEHEPELEKGLIHTKRRNTTDELGLDESTSRTNSAASLRSVSSNSSTGSLKEKCAVGGSLTISTAESSEDNFTTLRKQKAEPKSPVPYPLPMPPYGGYFAPMSEYLPEVAQSVQSLHRCNLAVMLMTDLVIDGLDVDWSIHLPLILHIIFLGMDHTKPLVHEHCKKLLLNLIHVISVNNNCLSLARLFINHRSVVDTHACSSSHAGHKHIGFTSSSPRLETQVAGFGGQPIGQSTFSVNSTATITPESEAGRSFDVESLGCMENVAKALIDFMATRSCKPLWSWEDITSKVLTIRSDEQLEFVLKMVLKIFKECLPLSHLDTRWGQVALQLALSCSSRHYAGRSLQLFRSLRVPLSTSMLSDILSRLVETVAEQGEDMQGYVTEIILTLEASIDNIDLELRPVDYVKEIFMSTPNLTGRESHVGGMRKSATVAMRHPFLHHQRSTSYSLSMISRQSAPTPVVSEVKAEPRQRTSQDLDGRRSTNLLRSRSAQSLKQAGEGNTDDKLTLLTQMFWLGVSLLESDYEYEFLLATRLLDKILSRIQLERPDCADKLDKIQKQIKWPNFPGVQALLLKGTTSPNTAEATWDLLAKLTLHMTVPAIDPSQAVGFPLSVISLLPYMVYHYEEPNRVCIAAAENISQESLRHSKKLENLATVMTLYSKGTFTKDSHQWTRCVVKYLHDVYANLNCDIMNLLIEMLEKGPVSCQLATLQILSCVVHFVDLKVAPAHSMNANILRVISKYVEGPHWREANNILKQVVTRSSTLAAAPTQVTPSYHSLPDLSMSAMSYHTSFAEAEISMKKELPGRTIDFFYDPVNIPVIGRKFMSTSTLDDHEEKDVSETTGEKQGAETHALLHQNTELTVTPCWKKPQSSQARTRERFVNLLTCYGQKHGLPPKRSPSDTFINKVVFSQSSDTLGRQESVCSSSEEASVSGGMGAGDARLEDSSNSDQLFSNIHVFDFLDNELDDRETESELGNFNIHFGNIRAEGTETPTPDTMGHGDDERIRRLSGKADESSDDDIRSVSPSPLDDMARTLSVNTSTVVPATLVLDHFNRRSSMSGSTHSIHTLDSDLDTNDFSPGTSSPNFSNMAATFVSLHSDEIEDIWRSHVNKVMADTCGQRAVNTYHLFMGLYKETRRKLTNLTKEACYYLSKTASLQPIATQFLNMLEVLLTHSECPLVYTEAETLVNCKILEEHKFCVLEINESHDTYLMRRELALECLDTIKSSIKNQSLGGNVSDFCGEEQQVELCRCLYKLHFQLLLLFESYIKLVGLLSAAAKREQVTDLSDEVVSLKKELNAAIQELDSGQVSPLPLDTSHMSKMDAQNHLITFMNERCLMKAVQFLRALRHQWPCDMFGVNADDDIPALMAIYCKQLADRKPGMVVITRAENDICNVTRRLMEVKLQLSASIHQLEQASKVDREVIMRQSESSSL